MPSLWSWMLTSCIVPGCFRGRCVCVCARAQMCAWMRVGGGTGDREGGYAYYRNITSKISHLHASGYGAFIYSMIGSWLLFSAPPPFPCPHLEGRERRRRGKDRWGMRGGWRAVPFYHPVFCWPDPSWSHCHCPASPRQLRGSELLPRIQNLSR